MANTHMHLFTSDDEEFKFWGEPNDKEKTYSHSDIGKLESNLTALAVKFENNIKRHALPTCEAPSCESGNAILE